jgi:hypothetical protein
MSIIYEENMNKLRGDYEWLCLFKATLYTYQFFTSASYFGATLSERRLREDGHG